jgi:hypothetical protein
MPQSQVGGIDADDLGRRVELRWVRISPAHAQTVDVAASPPAARLGSELAFPLHEVPDPGAVGADLGLDAGSSGRLVINVTTGW